MSNHGDNKRLREAVEFINAYKRGPGYPLLLVIGKCGHYFGQKDDDVAGMCGEEFPMLPQDFSRAREHGDPTICRQCSNKYKRLKRN